jgi:glycosyltransferase involved in cell wall biosynthesis
MKMRILVLSSVFPNPAQPQFGVFVRERMARVAAQCEIVIVAPVPWFPFNRLFRGLRTGDIPFFEVQDGMSVHHPRFLSVPGVLKCLDGFFYFLSVLPLVWRLRRRFHFDLIDVHFAYPDGVAGCLLAATFGCPAVVTLRGTIGKLAKFRLRRVQIRWVLKRAARILAVSESLKEIALGLGVGPDKIEVAPNGVDGQIFKPSDRQEARRKLGLSPERKIILSVGALSERKGHHRVVEALPEVLARWPDAEYIIIGGRGVEGDMAPAIERLSRELGVDKHIRLAGERRHEEIAQWLAAADLFCLATSNEGMANVILEALACGVPVVTTCVGGNGELIRDGENGFLVPFGDRDALVQALLRALAYEWDRDRIAAAMNARSWEATAARVVGEYDRITAVLPARFRAEEKPLDV